MNTLLLGWWLLTVTTVSQLTLWLPLSLPSPIPLLPPVQGDGVPLLFRPHILLADG